MVPYPFHNSNDQRHNPRSATILVSKNINLRIKDALTCRPEGLRDRPRVHQDLYAGMQNSAMPPQITPSRELAELSYFPDEY